MIAPQACSAYRQQGTVRVSLRLTRQARVCPHSLFMQDALRVKKVMREAQNAAGLAPGKALQH
ncbi:hypothetical protein GCM10011496_17690 [Polaromonas eurypsychrophila]|uniref:Uncharacterized protein n=1 Tax=Polaromonas eurypsychrophila TaxID=1614635 RepID=A0A916SH25_9BURK|nr:hypothetical protein GCM10011496_17690 [Polaromonas eurypsychrophila]